MKKLIDGIEVDLTPEEQAEYDARQNLPPVVIVPQKVTRAQFILALLQLNLLDVVEAAVASADQETRINYNERLEFERTHPLVMTMAAVLGKSEAEVDALFVLAATK